jgi:hypothetical protein
MHDLHASGSNLDRPLGRRIARRLVRGLFPAAALGLGVWLAPSESQAAPRCTSKPMVCARLANEQKARGVTRAPAPLITTRAPAAGEPSALAQNARARCTSKPIVCAREDARRSRPASPSVTLAQSTAEGARCTTKPAVCARLRVRPTAAPMTLAADELR